MVIGSGTGVFPLVFLSYIQNLRNELYQNGTLIVGRDREMAFQVIWASSIVFCVFL